LISAGSLHRYTTCSTDTIIISVSLNIVSEVLMKMEGNHLIILAKLFNIGVSLNAYAMDKPAAPDDTKSRDTTTNLPTVSKQSIYWLVTMKLW
jgi:hypothetical protein